MIDILIEKFISKNGKEKKIIKTIIKPSIGDRKNWNLLDWFGIINSLEKSLIASLNGCISPTILTLFGPLRIWLYPKIFRSINVIKATFTKIQIIKIK